MKISRKATAQPRGQRGFITLFILGAAAVIFMMLGLALQSNYRLLNTNRRFRREIQTQADTLRWPDKGGERPGRARGWP